MTGSSQELEEPIIPSLRESATTYLRALQGIAPDSTFLSHQNALQKFLKWFPDENSDTKSVETSLVRFVDYLLCDLNLRTDTVIGHVYSLLNFFAYHVGECPDILRERLILRVQSLTCPEITETVLVGEFERKPSSETQNSVETLQAYLNQRQYGTRIHAYVESIYETAGRPAQIRYLDLSHLNLEDQTVSVAIANTHIVASAGLQESRTCDLSSNLVDVLRTYIKHERSTPRSEDQPLFTTPHGRASTATLRRAVKSASDRARRFADATDAQNGSIKRVDVVPSDVWRVAIKEIGDEP